MSPITFTKMHGLGNDFIVIDGIHQAFTLKPHQIAALAKRDTGIGFDQCLVVEHTDQANIDFVYRIFNSNGQEVGQCGNGARCLARFIERKQLTTKKIISVATSSTTMRLHLNSDDSVTVKMDSPKTAPADIPLQVPHESSQYSIPMTADTSCAIHAIQVGNPHAIVIVPDIANAPVDTLGPAISEHPWFPEQTNVGFMEILTPQHIRLRVYERDCGETKACGSGAVAAAAIGRLYYQLASRVKVSLAGGDLFVEWPSLEEEITLTGPATFIYEGSLDKAFLQHLL